MGFFSKLKEKMAGDSSEVIKEAEDEYVEVGTGSEEETSSKVTVRPFIINSSFIIIIGYLVRWSFSRKIDLFVFYCQLFI